MYHLFNTITILWPWPHVPHTHKHPLDNTYITISMHHGDNPHDAFHSVASKWPRWCKHAGCFPPSPLLQVWPQALSADLWVCVVYMCLWVCREVKQLRATEWCQDVAVPWHADAIRHTDLHHFHSPALRLPQPSARGGRHSCRTYGSKVSVCMSFCLSVCLSVCPFVSFSSVCIKHSVCFPRHIIHFTFSTKYDYKFLKKNPHLLAVILHPFSVTICDLVFAILSIHTYTTFPRCCTTTLHSIQNTAGIHFCLLQASGRVDSRNLTVI